MFAICGTSMYFYSFNFYLIIFDDIARLPVSEHQVHTYRLCILITASRKHSMVKPDNIASKILN